MQVFERGSVDFLRQAPGEVEDSIPHKIYLFLLFPSLVEEISVGRVFGSFRRHSSGILYIRVVCGATFKTKT